MKNLLVLLIMIGGLSSHIALCYARTGKPSTSPSLQAVQKGPHTSFSKIRQFFEENGMYPLPLDFNRNLYPAMYKNKNVSRYPYPYIIKNSPFYVNASKRDTSHNDMETTIKNLFKESTGDYVLGIVSAWSGDHNAEKYWLTTFNSWGEPIDYIPIGLKFVNHCWIIEGQIASDLTVSTQELEFSDYDCIVDLESSTPLDNLKGQRIDRTYKITPEGKFKLTGEIKYQPQVYTSTMLEDKTKPIIQGEETR